MERMSKWSTHFRRTKNDALNRPSFYLKGSRSWLFSHDGYFGGDELLDDVISICENHKFTKRNLGHDSPVGVADYQTFYAFLDGGVDIFSGNYFFGEPGQGAYVRGFRALRWMLHQLNLSQPRKLKDESLVLGPEELNECLHISALPFVAISRSRSN